MRFKWKEVELEQVCERVNVGFVGTCHKFYTDSDGIKMIRTTNLGDFEIDESDLKYVTTEFHEKNIKSQIKKNDILVARHGDNGKAVRYTSDEPANTLNIVIITPNQNIIHPIFLELLFNSSIIKNQIQQSLVGSVQNVVNTKTIAKLKIPLPTLKEQHFLINILGSLVEKININKEIICLLENISIEVYKRWFIDFEFPNEQRLPYRSSGGEMIESELGEIPKEWSAELLSTVSDFLSGGTPKTKEESYWNGDIPFFTPKDVGSSIYCNGTEKTITELGLSKCNSRLYPKNTVFITARGTVGKIALANRDMAMNQSCFALKHKQDKQFYLLGVISNLLREIVQGANGAVFNAINLGDLNRLKFVSPPQELVEKYNDLVTPFYKQMSELEIENIKLRELRNVLLPKLLSGEIEIPEESVVESS